MIHFFKNCSISNFKKFILEKTKRLQKSFYLKYDTDPFVTLFSPTKLFYQHYDYFKQRCKLEYFIIALNVEIILEMVYILTFFLVSF